ncbi:MAG: dTDP-4-dehydrorhamnose reductase [Ferruginibacter sp.]|nr:dTDP-4-dehydrorhamnose reductase [Ferruginibacter sp.]
MDKKTILVTGADGQLGNEIRLLSANFPDYQFLFTNRQQLSIENADAVNDFFSSHIVDCCINCAAYTAVDKAETEQEKAFAINGAAVGFLAAACKISNALFIHISTDYVFDGSGIAPYVEDHPVSPVNFYGASKLKGEELALQNNEDAIVIRTSWVYSATGNNFVKTMLRLMSERTQIGVVNDQQGSPTFAADLAKAIMQIVEKLEGSVESFKRSQLPSGIFHYSNEGVITWFDFAVAIKELAGKDCVVNPISTAAFPTPARRPAYSVMDTNKIRQAYGVIIPGWKESLKNCMAQLSENQAH